MRQKCECIIQPFVYPSSIYQFTTWVWSNVVNEIRRQPWWHPIHLYTNPQQNGWPMFPIQCFTIDGMISWVGDELFWAYVNLKYYLKFRTLHWSCISTTTPSLWCMSVSQMSWTANIPQLPGYRNFHTMTATCRCRSLVHVVQTNSLIDQ